MQVKNLLWKYCLVQALFIWCLSSVLAQSELEQKTMQLFDSPISWVKQFEGKIDGVHQSKVCLAFDGINCKGFMHYTSSGEEYLLVGTLQGEDLVLLEKYKQEPSGYINGQLNKGQITLDWKSIDESNSYSAKLLEKNDDLDTEASEVLIFAGMLDEQNVKLMLRTNGQSGLGNLVYGDQRVEKVYATFNTPNDMKIENLSSGSSFRLVNTKENLFESSFILPGASVASHLGLMQTEKLDLTVQEYLSHSKKHEVILPRINESFDEELKEMIKDWELEVSSRRNKLSGERFADQSKIWFELETYNAEYISGVVYYNSTWNKNLASRTFTFQRREDKMMSLAPFLKGSAKWEKAIKDRMLAAKELNNTTEEDQYKKWINRAALMDPILCEGGLQFLTESNAVFGQASTFVPWKSLSPLVISPAKLTKLRKTK